MSMFRTLLSMSGGGGLPAEYQQVEYIQSTGTQYIDTNVIIDNNLGYEINCNQTGMNGYYDVILGGQKSNIGVFVMNTFEQDIYKKSLRYYNTEDKYTSSYNFYQKDITIKLQNNVYTFNDGTNQETRTVGNATTYNSNAPLYIFGMYDNSGAGCLTRVKVYSCKIYNNNDLIRDFVPCYRKSDNVIGMYDLVNNVFYTNAGSGTFEKGGDI